MVAQFITALHLPISKTRLETYRPPGGTDLDMLITYLWNVELSQAFYPVLHTLEVSLRNSTHAAASTIYGTDFWFDKPGILAHREANLVTAARDELKKTGKPQNADRIVAQLMFGFWTGLLNQPYQKFWHTNNLAMIRATFPRAPRRYQNRLALLGRYNAIRSLRNRVFHFEAIWSHPNLADEHRNILRAIDWISAEMVAAIGLCDSFPRVFQGGRADIEARIKNHLGIP